MRRILSFIMLFLELKVIKAQFLTYDFGDEQRFDYGITKGFSCHSGATYTFDIAYNGIFERNPQILISPHFYTRMLQAVGFLAPAGYTLHKSKESTTGFQVNVTCKWFVMYSLRFNWTAIDDKRIEILDAFSLDMANIPNQNYTFSHQNPNALQGFVILVSFVYQGPINITLNVRNVEGQYLQEKNKIQKNYILIVIQIIEITKTQVSIGFTTSNNNLLSLGYQIILGTSKAFNQSSTIYSQISSTVFYQSGTLQWQKQNKNILYYNNSKRLEIDHSFFWIILSRCTPSSLQTCESLF